MLSHLFPMETRLQNWPCIYCLTRRSNSLVSKPQVLYTGGDPGHPLPI
jgi:hypothetical protein